MKWEQMFVAYSDCGQYKIEVDESLIYGWDWTLYELEDGEWNYLRECESRLESHFEAKREGHQALDKILAEDKAREEEMAARVDDLNRPLFGIDVGVYPSWSAMKVLWSKPTDPADTGNLDEFAPKCRFCLGAGVHECPGGQYNVRGCVCSVIPGLVDAAAFPHDGPTDYDSVKKLLLTGELPAAAVEQDEELLGLLGLKENGEHLIEDRLAKQRFGVYACKMCDEPLRYDNCTGICLQCQMQPSGYDQVLTAIKNESKSVKL